MARLPESRHSRRVGYVAFLCLTFAITLLGPPSAEADHNYLTYRDRGYVWFAAYDNLASAQTTSNFCNERELEAYNRTEATTVGQFANKWANGIIMSRDLSDPCNGNVTSSVDIRLWYRDSQHFIRDDGSSYGGYNVSYLAPKSWCDIWNKNDPCGTHPAVVHLNESRFGGNDYSHHYRRRLIMHETGHSFGLAHHCTSDSIMNDGTSSCNGGAWTNINGYQPTDINGFRDLYPNWKYN